MPANSTETTPVISIIMPMHNEASTLVECLDSINGQCFLNYELIIIDDGSTDNSAEIISNYAQSDTRITLFQPSHIGLVSALNMGLTHSVGQYIARMDADDIMHAQRLEKQYQFMTANPDIGLISSRARLFPQALIKSGYLEYMKWQNNCLTPDEIDNQIYVESPFAHPSVMFRRTVLENVGHYRNGDFPEDYDLWLRIHHAGIKMSKLDETLLDWRESPDRTSRTDPRYKTLSFDRLRAKYLSTDKRIQDDRPLIIWGAGRKTRQRAQLLIEKGFNNTGWIDVDPNKIGNVVKGRPVYSPDWLLNQAPKPFVLNYVNNYGARVEIESYLDKAGYLAGVDYLSVG